MFGIGWAELLILVLILLFTVVPGIIGVGVIVWLVMKNRSKATQKPIDAEPGSP